MTFFKNVLGRDPEESNRSATPLELFFDLVYVVAIASAAAGLHHKLLEHHVIDGVGWYLFAFFVIWWCWMNFTWYASAFDTDDAVYRLITFVQIFGALVMAVGVNSFFDPDHDLILGLIGYLIMRVALILHWIRAGSSDPKNRTVAYTYAVGIFIVQMLWVVDYYLAGDYFIPLSMLFILAEISVPMIAESRSSGQGTPWHPEHIAERYGLLVIIVLGEGVLATTSAISSRISSETLWSEVFPLGLGTAGLIFSLWWSYFKVPFDKILEEKRFSLSHSLLYGYGHFFVFASLAAVGAGLQLVADVASVHQGNAEHEVSGEYTLLCIAVAMAVYFVMMNIYDRAYSTKCVRPFSKWLIGLLVPFVPVLVHFWGMPLHWAICFASLTPILFILAMGDKKVHLS